MALCTVALQAPRSWDSPSKNAGVSCQALLQGIFSTQGANPHLLHWRVGSLPPAPPGGRVLHHKCQLGSPFHITGITNAPVSLPSRIHSPTLTRTFRLKSTETRPRQKGKRTASMCVHCKAFRPLEPPLHDGNTPEVTEGREASAKDCYREPRGPAPSPFT